MTNHALMLFVLKYSKYFTTHVTYLDHIAVVSRYEKFSDNNE